MIFPDVDFHWFPLTNPGIVTIPFSFLCGYLAIVVSPPAGRPRQQQEVEVRAITGIGSGLSPY